MIICTVHLVGLDHPYIVSRNFCRNRILCIVDGFICMCSLVNNIRFYMNYSKHLYIGYSWGHKGQGRYTHYLGRNIQEYSLYNYQLFYCRINIKLRQVCIHGLKHNILKCILSIFHQESLYNN